MAIALRRWPPGTQKVITAMARTEMIRQFTPSDTEKVVDIWLSASALAHPFLDQNFVAQETENLRNIYLVHAETWLIEHNDRPVGFIAMLDTEIGGLFLEPALHGQGLGRALADHAYGLKGPMTVEVFAQNAIGRRFYDRYGFAETGQFIHEPTGQQVVKMAMKN